MASQLPPARQRFLDKFSKSRDFTISFTIHAILLLLFGGSVLYQVVQEPLPIETTLVRVPGPPKPPAPPDPLDQVLTPVALPASGGPAITTQELIKTGAENHEFIVPDIQKNGDHTMLTVSPTITANKPDLLLNDRLTKEEAKRIGDFIKPWVKDRKAGGTIEAEFTAYIGQYEGGDWSSTVRLNPDGKIETGSLSNLLYLMSFWSKEKIKTNYKNVQAIRLDSDEIFTVKPPFIFLTGTQDFALTEKEVLNLRKYISLGGCVWGDSSVPGLRSRFDLAFRREMKRVIPDLGVEFEPLPADHPLFTKAYFPKIKEVPSGLNFYRLPVYAMKRHGEVAILYTANDYGDMWQIGLDSTGQIDFTQDALHRYVAVNIGLYSMRGVYARNLTPESLDASYRFGTNLVVHLLTRWDDKVAMARGSSL